MGFVRVWRQGSAFTVHARLRLLWSGHSDSIAESCWRCFCEIFVTTAVLSCVVYMVAIRFREIHKTHVHRAAEPASMLLAKKVREADKPRAAV